MECTVCFQKSGQHFCAACVRQLVSDQRQVVNKQRFETVKLGETVEAKLATIADDTAKRRLIKKLQENIQMYRKQAQHARGQLIKEREELRKRQVSLRQRKQRVNEAKQTISKIHCLMTGDRGITGSMLQGLSMTLEDYSERVSMERKKLIMQLVDLFPLESDGNADESIAKLPLPSNIKALQAMNEDARSAVLAIVVRVLHIASSYLSLTLPFRMEFLGSKASIGRWGDGEPQTMLTGTGLALESGMIMLRKNVEALCFYQGIPTSFVKEWSLIHSLWQLFHSPSLGNSVHQSLLEASARVGRVPAGKHLRQPPSGEVFVQRGSNTSGKPRRPPKSTMLVSPVSSPTRSSSQGTDAWDIIERPQPPKPSKDEDIQHWVKSGAGET
mmetsp:Transcript_1770/g.2912  ORF Transcript_1770/g.2912 Transcript_1770/m.2912 type:complete len:386 (+) Transcript_1770:315-1472(+)|eukprot:CAMPEP_0203752054 /NCGR_PEP_ID=MMETSP0098-20131031/6038_1 /ASSEMBLY_ACC=CAM_ASM_000208 /TAXON_ID=96639 /ORGANISM=" , Strain NY0313808BC1" /LENGTH=385 /DNA_ID=CAMNT_0050642051 /DNA_START=1861 /DNA_END=3018 /DNA_ORIENTATION=-